MTPPLPLVVGISGASGIAYGVRLLEVLGRLGIPTHLVMTRTAEITLAYETSLKVAEVKALATQCHKVEDLTAAPSSGSFRTRGMIVAPCSARTLGAVAAGAGENLLTRAADVTLKERRTLVLMVRETPLHLGHIRAMAAVTEMGAVVAPPMPAFYSRPQTLDDVVDHGVGRVLDLFGIDAGLVARWRDDDSGADAVTA
ncbi:UbiX family flavin prenyltransferase [Roseospira goensis]|uniref:Flavin prenyltransferase UbiX n=1 Tax=Roseospira goensis TaxID=391922 RepID=A0A7W6S1D2_9PROT|nr:UbiX family flavin prenyltransferase [Roseospira goensis]MBB4286419.1 4-hydroxy-3-polyprenylbenzoate decarboxylase [Roseospira goensis]